MTTLLAKYGMGFRPLLAKERRKWLGTRRWWMHMLLWLIILNGLLAVMLFVLPSMTTPDGEPVMPDSPISSGLQMFLGMGALALAIAVPVLVQDEIIGEKQSGTADWILSKPVARAAFFLSKVVAHSLGVTLFMVIIPALGAYLLLTMAESGAVSAGSFALAAGLILLHTLFYLMLALLLGVLVNSRTLVLGITIGFFFAGQFVAGFVPFLDAITPWTLPKIAVALATNMALLGGLAVPVLATAGWIIVFLFIAIWRFERSECA